MSILKTIKLVDTGYRTVSGEGTCSVVAVGDSEVAGGTLTVDVDMIDYNFQTLLNSRDKPGKYENNDQNEVYGLTKVDKVGISVPKIKISGVADSETTAGCKMLAKIVMMAKTHGVKKLTGEEPSESWINYINYYDDYYADSSKSASSNIDEIYVIIENIDINSSADHNLVSWSLEMRETS